MKKIYILCVCSFILAIIGCVNNETKIALLNDPVPPEFDSPDEAKLNQSAIICVGKGTHSPSVYFIRTVSCATLFANSDTASAERPLQEISSFNMGKKMGHSPGYKLPGRDRMVIICESAIGDEANIEIQEPLQRSKFSSYRVLLDHDYSVTKLFCLLQTNASLKKPVKNNCHFRSIKYNWKNVFVEKK